MRALSSVLLLGGAICLVSAALDRWLFDVQTLVPMGIGAISVVLSPFAYLVRKRTPTALVHATLCLSFVLVLVAVAFSGTAEAAITKSFMLPCLAMIAAWAFDRRVALTYAAAATVGMALVFLPLDYPRMIPAALACGATISLATAQQSRTVAKLRNAAVTDPLTGLLNRRGVFGMLDDVLGKGQLTGREVQVAVIDLDGFKSVNDQFGHAAGDELLRSLSLAWHAELLPGQHLARLGGDEFLAVVVDQPQTCLPQLLARMRQANEASWSCGAASARRHEQASLLVARADHELIKTKDARRALGLPGSRRRPKGEASVRAGTPKSSLMDAEPVDADHCPRP